MNKTSLAIEEQGLVWGPMINSYLKSRKIECFDEQISKNSLEDEKVTQELVWVLNQSHLEKQ